MNGEKKSCVYYASDVGSVLNHGYGSGWGAQMLKLHDWDEFSPVATSSTISLRPAVILPLGKGAVQAVLVRVAQLQLDEFHNESGRGA